jgi:protein-S-isoprenylcysteine O-methyltransferase Ste14
LKTGGWFLPIISSEPGAIAARADADIALTDSLQKPRTNRRIMPDWTTLRLALLLALGWSLYYALHSLLASESAKAWVRRRWPALDRYYRLGYNLLAITLLALLLVLTVRWEGAPLLYSKALAIVGWILIISGAGVIVAAFRTFDMWEFLGVQRSAEQTSPRTLITRGLYRIVRHPLYLGTMLLALGLCMAHLSPGRGAILLVTLIYLVIGSRLEEQKLIREYGAAYEGYRKKAKSLIPWVW